MNDGNNRLGMTLKINVGCLSLTSEMNDGNNRLRMMLKTNVGCLSLASEMNGGNIRLCMTLKISYVLHYFHRFTGSDKTKPGPDRDGRDTV